MAFEATRLMYSAMNVAAAAKAVRLVDEMLNEEPALTGQQILERLNSLKAQAEAADQKLQQDLVKRAECRHCRKSITARGERWTHDSDGSVGCRAASFSVGEGWNDDLDRRWKASPPKS